MRSQETQSGHFLLSSSSPEHIWVQVGEQIIWESLYEKLLGITIDKDVDNQLSL